MTFGHLLMTNLIGSLATQLGSVVASCLRSTQAEIDGTKQLLEEGRTQAQRGMFRFTANARDSGSRVSVCGLRCSSPAMRQLSRLGIPSTQSSLRGDCKMMLTTCHSQVLGLSDRASGRRAKRNMPPPATICAREVTHAASGGGSQKPPMRRRSVMG